MCTSMCACMCMCVHALVSMCTSLCVHHVHVYLYVWCASAYICMCVMCRVCVCVWLPPTQIPYCAMVSGSVDQGGMFIICLTPRRAQTGSCCHLGSWLQSLIGMIRVPTFPGKKKFQGFQEEGRSLSHLERLPL